MKLGLLVLLNISSILGKQRLSPCQTTILNCCDPKSRLPLPLRWEKKNKRVRSEMRDVDISDVSSSTSVRACTGQEDGSAPSLYIPRWERNRKYFDFVKCQNGKIGLNALIFILIFSLIASVSGYINYVVCHSPISIHLYFHSLTTC